MPTARRPLCLLALAALLAGCGASAGRAARTPSDVSVATDAPSTAQRSTPHPSRSDTRAHARPTAPSGPVTSPPATHGAPAAAHRLPLPFGTGDATQVVTVVASTTSSTTAVVQAWRRSGGGWVRWGRAATGYVGSDGLSRHASEARSATPIGSFTLTRAFGALANPGTSLPYRHTDAADWWISQAGPLYNTLQHCSSGCAFTRGSPNEHLYTETPAYDHAVVIDYNTADSPGGVRAGAGSAFFLHVSQGAPTAGCVAVPAADLVRILRWLDPADHPRILIGS